MHQKKKVAVLIHACDRYELLFKGFEHFFSKYWDFDIECNYYFATENITAEIAGFQNIKSGTGAWADRLKVLLTEIKEDYILYFQEDMWLNAPVDKSFFKQLFDLAAERDWKQVKLHSAEVYQTNQTDLFINGFNVARVDNEKSGYLMSHQVTLWQKDFLKDQLYKNEHPWRNEKRGTKRLKRLNPEIYHIDFFAENGFPAINKNKPGIARSEYYSVSINGTFNQHIERYINALREGNAQEVTYAEKIQHHYSNSLTHDNKPKPRKDDIFKKIKNWFKS